MARIGSLGHVWIWTTFAQICFARTNKDRLLIEVVNENDLYVHFEQKRLILTELAKYPGARLPCLNEQVRSWIFTSLQFHCCHWWLFSIGPLTGNRDWGSFVSKLDCNGGFPEEPPHWISKLESFKSRKNENGNSRIFSAWLWRYLTWVFTKYVFSCEQNKLIFRDNLKGFDWLNRCPFLSMTMSFKVMVDEIDFGQVD